MAGISTNALEFDPGVSAGADQLFVATIDSGDRHVRCEVSYLNDRRTPISSSLKLHLFRFEVRETTWVRGGAGKSFATGRDDVHIPDGPGVRRVCLTSPDSENIVSYANKFCSGTVFEEEDSGWNLT